MSFKSTGMIINQTKNFNVRSGAIAVKKGMTSVWDAETSTFVPATLLSIDNVVFDAKNTEKHGYNALVLSYGNAIKINKPLAGNLKLITKNITEEGEKSDITEKKYKDNWGDVRHKKYAHARLKEFRTDLTKTLNIGDQINASYFQVGQLVDISGITIGKGFAGGMKRWNFRGLEASHGVSVSHRSSGSTGQRQDPGRTFKGKKMPGHMGARRSTIMNLKVLCHYENNPSIIVVKGSVPGHNGAFLEIRDAVKE